jgi:SAM-dependent methyltransferase
MSDAGTVPAPSARADDTNEVVWHDLECGSYRADLPLWRELAARQPGPILDIGAGTGRVALDLATAGHSVTALDREPTLLEALRARTPAQCLVPMQTIQLLAGPADRARFLRRARATLRRGGLLACAVLTHVEPFACTAQDAGPVPETVLVDGRCYTSRPTRVAVGRQSVVIERERSVLALSEPRDGEPPIERYVVELLRLPPRTLKREASSVGMRPEPGRDVAATEDHAGSTVVMLRA